MRNGVKFNGLHSYQDLGLIMESKNRPILPESKIIVEEAAGTDGEFDYSDSNPEGRTKYKTRPHDIGFSLQERNMALLRIKAHEIANWLACGEQQLIYDDETAVFYMARVVNQLDLENLIVSLRKFTVRWKSRPYAYSVVDSTEQIQFDQGLTLGYGYKLDMVPLVFNITGATTLNIYNPGRFVKPIIRITGVLTNISFTTNGKTLTYGAASASGTIDIDCSKPQAVKGTDNVNNNIAGDYIEFVHGDNQLQITGAGLNCTVTLIFRYLYL
jgi:predicted phage tail component-like protein